MNAPATPRSTPCTHVAVELYIYYRAPEPVRQPLQLALLELQSMLHRRYPGLRARLLRRDLQTLAEPAATIQAQDTWMETYRFEPPHAMPERFETELELAARAVLDSLSPSLGAGRKVERFVDIPAHDLGPEHQPHLRA
jgi:hypothetical protein